MPIGTLDSLGFSFWASRGSSASFLSKIALYPKSYVRASARFTGHRKFPLVTALGVTVRKRVFRVLLTEIIDVLSRAERNGRLLEKRASSALTACIVDEIGYLTISWGATPLLHLVNHRYEKAQ
ncbi:ATP-binding protein [Limimaricola soesokkakensis]|uniref:ATP-binding protein n=1 Tax=Limimaricola soesokkakensis TaxID=1343159 RepID=UPI0035132295